MARIYFTQKQVDEFNAIRGKNTQELKYSPLGKRSSQPNETELRFEEDYLAPWKSLGQIIGYRFHAMALIWPEYRYTPDWMVWNWAGQITLIEVKGAHIHSRDSRIRFLTARRDYPWFGFECWQWKNREWRKIWE